MDNFKSYITESVLSGREIYKYQWRIDLFLQKYKDGDFFELKGGKTVAFKYQPKVAMVIKKKGNVRSLKLLGKDGKEYKLTDLQKNKEFGGGGGSGAGAGLTKLVECAQALYIAARFNGSKKYTVDDLKLAWKSIDVDEKLDSMLYSIPDDWRESSILGAEMMYKLFRKNKYTIHRGSRWMDDMEKQFKLLNKPDKVFSNVNKWTPADIWMVTPKGKGLRVSETTNLTELNALLTEALKSGDIVGVSLKKMVKKANLSYHNYNEKKKVIEFVKYTTGLKGFWGAKDVYLYFTVDGRIQFRTFPDTFQGEIKGKNAAQGKLSYGPIQSILRRKKIPMMMDIKPLRLALKTRDKVVLETFYANYSRYGGGNVPYDEFIEKVYEKGEQWAFSKFLGTQLIDLITKSNMQDEFIAECIGYASSTSELSAPFIKIK